MSGRLGDIHRRLRADHVPCTVDYRPGLGTVLLVGVDGTHPAARSAVQVHEAGGQYWIRQGGETFRIPPDADDETMVNSVKLRVVHAWAEQGDEAALTVLAKVHDLQRRQAPQWQPARPAAFPDPFALAFEMVDAAFRIGWSMTVPGPLGVFRVSYGMR